MWRACSISCSILPGETKPLVLELPSYKLPSLRSALLATLDRSVVTDLEVYGEAASLYLPGLADARTATPVSHRIGHR